MPIQSRVILIALSMLPFILPIALAFDLYLPSVPMLSQVMAVSSQQMQLTLSVFLLAFGLGQLIIGPLSDNFGRKRILLISLLLFTLGSLMCALAVDFSFLLNGRVLQAIGASGSQVIAFAMIRDQYDGKEAKIILTLLRTSGSLSPIISPLLGAFMLTQFNWQANFVFLTAYSIFLLLFAYFFLQETVKKSAAKTKAINYFFKNYKEVITHPQFIYFCVCGIAAQAVVFMHSSFSPSYYINQHGLSESQFAVLFGSNACILFIGGLLTAKFIPIVGLLRWTLFAAFLLILSGAIMIFAQLYFTHHFALFLPNLLATISAGMLAGTSIAGALIPFKHMGGTASALLGCFEFVISAAIGSQIIGHGHNTNLFSLAGCFIFLGIAIYVIRYLVQTYSSKDLVTIS